MEQAARQVRLAQVVLVVHPEQAGHQERQGLAGHQDRLARLVLGSRLVRRVVVVLQDHPERVGHRVRVVLPARAVRVEPAVLV